MLAKIAGPQFDHPAEYDSFVQTVFKDIEDFVRMKADPYYKEVVAPDHENFADTTRSRYVELSVAQLERLTDHQLSMTVGWVEDHVLDGKVLE